MEAVDGILLAAIAALVAGVYLTSGVGLALIVAGLCLGGLWALLSVFGADE
jgi:hypothetical protein